MGQLKISNPPSSTKTIIMKGSAFLVAIIALHSVASLPSISIEDQTRKCYSAFYRCCSSEIEIPQRCFELNNCVLNFNSLQNYNSICHGIYPQEPLKKRRNYKPIYFKSFAKQVQVHISFSLNNAMNRTLLLLNVLLNKSCNL